MANPEPNTLISNQRVRILDVLGEGVHGGLYIQSGVSGSNPLCSIYLDDTPILNGDGSPNFNVSGQGFSWGYRSGTSGQTYIAGFEKVETLVPLPANPRVTFPPENNGFAKPVVVAFNTTMYPDAEAVKVTMKIPALYSYNTSNGETKGYNVGWLVECQLNGGAWTTLDTQNIQGKCTSPYLKTKTYPLPKTNPVSTFYEWKVRIKRTTRFIDSTNTANDLYVDAISVVSSNTYRYPMTAMVGLSMSADQFSNLPTRAYDVKGIQVAVPQGYTPTKYDETTFDRQCDYDSGNKLIGMTTQTAAELAGIEPGTYVSGPGIPQDTIVVSVNRDGPFFFAINKDPTSTLVNSTLTFYAITPGVTTAAVYPSVWDGTFGTKVWTDNPAWIFYDLCTNKRYGLGNYIRTEWMDKWTLYQIAQFCDEMVDDGDGGLEPRFSCNVAIQSAEDAYTLLNNLVSVFRGMLYWANGRITPVGSEVRNPVFNFTNANVIGGVFSYSDTPRNTRSTVCLVKWVDPRNLFRTAVERVEDPNGIARYGVITKEITAFATTSKGQAVRAANWVLTVEQALTETINFQTDMEGVYLRPGDVFNVYDNFRNDQQQGGRIASFSDTRDFIELDKQITLLPGFYYHMSALVPATNLAGTGLTGSSQIDYIRNSQIETRDVLTGPGTGITHITVGVPFSSGLYKGSVWILNGSGSSVSVFDKATLYKTLATSEPENGIVQILGVEYETGINTVVNNNYSIETSPPIAGDTTPPAAPTGLIATRVTGVLNDNSFYSYVQLTWTGSTSANTAYHTVSGQHTTNQPFVIGSFSVPQASTSYTPTGDGDHTFSVAAFNANGYGSAWARIIYNEPAVSPFSGAASLSGIFIKTDYDEYTASSALGGRYTGYIGNTPTFGWNILTDPITENETPSAQFITGYRVRVLNITNEASNLGPDIFISGKENRQWTVDDRFLFTGTSIKPLRAFTLSVDTMDDYGNIASGVRLTVNNLQPRPPIASGFVGFGNGLNYTVTPAQADQADISGIYIWTSTSPSFTPTFDNKTAAVENLAGIAPFTGFGELYSWYALIDNFGYSGSTAANGDSNSRIYGPISGNTNGVADASLATRNELYTTGTRLSAVLATGSTILNTANVSGIGGIAIIRSGISMLLVSGAEPVNISITGSSRMTDAIFTGVGQTTIIRSGAYVTVQSPSIRDFQGDGFNVSGGGFRGIPQYHIVNSNITISGEHNGKHLYHANGDGPRTWTITGNSTIPLPIGFVVTFVNDTDAGNITINSPAGELIVLAGNLTTGTTGNRLLTSNGIATALKVGPTRWQINGANIT